MKMTRYSEPQILAILSQAEGGVNRPEFAGGLFIQMLSSFFGSWRRRKVCSLSNAKEEHLENLVDFTSSAPLSRVAEVQWALI